MVDGDDCLAGDLSLLSKLPELEEVELYGKAFDDEVVSKLVLPPRVASLGLYETSVTNRTLAELRSRPGLEKVILSLNEGITSAGLRHLAALPRLEAVGLDADLLNTVGLSHVAGLAKIESLWLEPEGDFYTSEGSCRGAPHCFDLRSDRLTSAGFVKLKNLPIEHLLLLPERLDEAILAQIASMPTVRSVNCVDTNRKGSNPRCLDLAEARVTAGAVARLFAGKKLSHLVTEPSEIDGSVLYGLSKTVGLSSLNCHVCNYPPAGGAPYCSFVDSCVNLEETRITKAALWHLTHFSGIEELWLPDDLELSTGSAQVVFSLPELSQLNCPRQGCFDLRGIVRQGAIYTELPRAKKLTELILSGTDVTDESISKLPELAGLTKISLEGTSVSQEAVKKILSIPRLESLSVPPELIDGSMVPLVAAHPRLNQLNFDCDRVCPTTCVVEKGFAYYSSAEEFACRVDVRECGEACSATPESLMIDLDLTTLGRSDISKLGSIPRELRLYVEEVDDADVARLASLPNLSSLNCDTPACVDLESSTVTSRGIAHLRKLKGLRKIVIPPGLLDDATLAIFGELRQLETMPDLVDSAVTRRGILRLGKLHELKRLSLDPELLDDRTLATLSKLRSLVSLNSGFSNHDASPADAIVLTGSKVTRRGVSAITSFRKATAFVVPPELVHDALLESLLSLPSFDSLNCDYECEPIPEGSTAGSLAACLRGSCVNLQGTKVSKRGLKLAADRGFKKLVPPRGLRVEAR